MKSSSSSLSTNKKHFVPPLIPSNSNVTISSNRTLLTPTNELTKDRSSSSSNVDDSSSSIVVKQKDMEKSIASRDGQNTSNSDFENEKQTTNAQHHADNASSFSKEYTISTHFPQQTSVWPIHFDDKFAVSNGKLKSLPATNKLIQSQIMNENKSICIRFITWNQQAKQLFKTQPSVSTTSATVSTIQPSLASLNKSNESPQNQIKMEPIDDQLTHKLFYSSSLQSTDLEKRYHIIAIGTQECENSISKSILNPMKEKWERYCKQSLGDDYEYVQGHALQASHLVIFAHKAITHMISNISSYAVPTGICNTLGNKGGIGIRLSIGKSSFCFVTAHLAAHQEQIDRRTLEFATISSEIAHQLGRDKRDLTLNTNDERILKNISSPISSHGNIPDTIASTTSLDSIEDVENEEDDEYQALRGESDSFDSNEKVKNNKSSLCNMKSPCCQPSRCCSTKSYIDRRNPLLKEFDYVFWGGDLNYRINATRDVVDSLLEEDRHDILISNDQLRLLLQFEKTFAGFVEGPVTFRPTYKYDKGKDVYDTSAKRRIPAWTDRILFKRSSNVEMLSYFCNQDVRESDHRPVYASFKCQIEVDPAHSSSSENVFRSESKSEVCVIS